MKKQILLLLMMLLPLVASAVEINGINYEITVYGKTAEVAKKAYQGSVNIPDYITYNGVKFDVTGIAEKAFEGCTELTSVTIGNNVKYIRESAFEGWSGLSSVTIYRVITIGANAFKDCKSLLSIDMPDTMKTIETGAFSGCTGLTDVYCYAKDVPDTYTFPSYKELNAFYGSNMKHVTLHVPAASVWDYKSRTPWKDFGNIVPLDDAVGVVGVQKDDSDTTPIFDLQGRRLMGKPVKGIYIQNGKKHVMK